MENENEMFFSVYLNGERRASKILLIDFVDILRHKGLLKSYADENLTQEGMGAILAPSGSYAAINKNCGLRGTLR